MYYRDTDQDHVKRIISRIESGVPWKQTISEEFQNEKPWLYQIITSPKRTKFIDEFLKPRGKEILDIGAGWGQFTIPLARNNNITAIEPTPERLQFIKSVAKQENLSSKINFIGADYLETNLNKKFDLVLSIGVLEWIAAFHSTNDPRESQIAFLNKTRRDLKQNGRLIIGIENRLGLKYLLGCRDDHTGLADISCYDMSLAKFLFKQKTGGDLRCFTYSKDEYNNMLSQVGFKNISFYAAFPDYKLPKVILSADNPDKINKFFISGQFIEEHDGCDGYKFIKQDRLKSHYYSFAKAGIASFFAPSFFIECS